MKKRPEYLQKYHFDWDVLDVIINGFSAVDARSFLVDVSSKSKVNNFLKNYGFEQEDAVLKAELFGNFQESMQFIRRYFLKENNPEDGLDITIPVMFSTITEASDLFLMVWPKSTFFRSYEDRLWAMVILKVMHTLAHVDKDLRQNYFPIIQQQIFDRFYKYLVRDDGDRLYLGEDSKTRIPLHSFATKAKKNRDSLIIKLLHKAENVAEEVFDRVGVRFVTFTKLDALKVIKFLQNMNIVIPHNIKPSRSYNSLVDMIKFKESYHNLIRNSIRGQYAEEKFLEELHLLINECVPPERGSMRNEFTSRKYRAIQFTCRQLIKYKNPFMAEFSSLRAQAKNTLETEKDNRLAQKILELDASSIAKDIRFFYPFEVQVVDVLNHEINTIGEASHRDYKKQQIRTAMIRLFRPLIKYKNLKVDFLTSITANSNTTPTL
ncbi:MAG: TIGR04552 family protein [Oligoflexia bacterium]|nr:TIGR04552 family protein [Oligoflexia bacterium]